MRVEHVRFERPAGHRLYRGHGFWDLTMGRWRWRLHYAQCTCDDCNQTGSI